MPCHGMTWDILYKLICIFEVIITRTGLGAALPTHVYDDRSLNCIASLIKVTCASMGF